MPESTPACPSWCEQPRCDGQHRANGIYVPASMSLPIPAGRESVVPEYPSFPAVGAHLLHNEACAEGLVVALHITETSLSVEDVEVQFALQEALAFAARLLEAVEKGLRDLRYPPLLRVREVQTSVEALLELTDRNGVAR